MGHKFRNKEMRDGDEKVKKYYSTHSAKFGGNHHLEKLIQIVFNFDALNP